MPDTSEMTHSDSPPVQAQPVTTSRLQPVAFALLTAALVALCAVVAAPLLSAITWAVALAVVFWPVHARLIRKHGHPGLMAFTITAVVGVAIIGCAAFLTWELARRAAPPDANQNPSPPELLKEAGARYPALGDAIQWADRAGIDPEGQVQELTARVYREAGEIARGSLRTAAQLAVALYLLFHLLRDRDRLMAAVRALLPLSRAEADRVLKRSGEAVFANLYANGATSAIDSVVGLLVFWAVGLPSPALWAAVVFILSLIPPFGASIVWAPASAYLALTGNWPGAAAVLLYGLVTWTLVDNALYARLAGEGMGIHPAAALVAVIGGLAVFHAAGLVLGPAILAVTGAVFEVWKARRQSEEMMEQG